MELNRFINAFKSIVCAPNEGQMKGLWAEMAIDPEPLDLARDRLEVDRTEQGTWLEISSIEPNRASLRTPSSRVEPST